MPKTLPEHQELVNALLLLGWYRTWEGPSDNGGQPLWGFCHRHRTDCEPEKTLWVPGACELEAMRALLTQLWQAQAELAVPEGADIERRSPE